MNANGVRTTEQKLALFARFFTGRTDVYGSYDPSSGRSYQVKAPVTRGVLMAHLRNQRPYGVYLLVEDRTRALAVDFDNDDPSQPMEFIAAAKHYGIPAYIERRKSKGYHAWIFFEDAQTPAAKARSVARHILEEIGAPEVEVFPKHNRLDQKTTYGNFINAPLFGALVPHGRTVFVDETGALKPYPNQWDFLENVKTVPEVLLDEIIEINDLKPNASAEREKDGMAPAPASNARSYGLPPCAQRMLSEGVRDSQRVAAFRLAVQLRKAGLPRDIAIAALKTWACKNQPDNGKGVITEKEILDQTAWAYAKQYRGCGCEDPAIVPFCDPSCPLSQRRRLKR